MRRDERAVREEQEERVRKLQMVTNLKRIGEERRNSWKVRRDKVGGEE